MIKMPVLPLLWSIETGKMTSQPSALPDGITMTTQETLKYVQDYDMIILGFEKLENMHNLK